ncbi:hypothetical protein ACQUQP_06810 [Marinobacterium sp. YM272]|uniref:hypothetical protein n=1 Tax=Marinobacterium sp. YM272 TaxID=3421654 RepID=UPI003D7F3FFF
MRYSPPGNARPYRFALLAFMLALGVSACSTGRSTESRAGADVAPVKAETGSISSADRLQGRWRSLNDASASLEIDGNTVLSIYVDTVVSKGVLRFVNNCEAQIQDPQGEFFTVADEADTLCYHLTLAGERLLEFVYIPGGKTLTYERIE